MSQASNSTWAQAYQLISDAQHIVVLQAENPDGDSLGSALALEELLGDMGKQTTLFCAIELPKYLHYFPGWDRVTDELPSVFDLAIIVDASVQSLFEKTLTSDNQHLFAKAGLLIFDHHGNFAQEDHLSTRFTQAVTINEPQFVATSELLYNFAKTHSISVNAQAAEHMLGSILADSLGLASEAVTPATLRTVSELAAAGASISAIDHRRREFMKKAPEILAYKGRLLQRITYHLDGALAIVQIPWEEIAQYSDQYNPSVLVLDEMRLVTGVHVAIAIKTYPDGKLTAKIRANPESMVADKIAAHFAGGGHPPAAGFKVHTNDPKSIVQEMITATDNALRELEATRTEPC